LPILKDIEIHPVLSTIASSSNACISPGPAPHDSAFYIADRPMFRGGKLLPGRITPSMKHHRRRAKSGSTADAHFTWYESRNARIAIGGIVGLLAIGGSGHLFCECSAARLRQKPITEPQPAYDLDRFKSEPLPHRPSSNLRPKLWPIFASWKKR
jgi:hypothetical protein